MFLIVNFVFFQPRFLEWEFLSDWTFSRSLSTCTFFILLAIVKIILLDFFQFCMSEKLYNQNVIVESNY